MRNSLLFMIFAMTSLVVISQDQYKISFDAFQIVEDGSTSLQNQIKFPIKDTMVVMGGLNDLDGMNNYFNIFGGKLIVDIMDDSSKGVKQLVLRREDGRNFYDLFPTLKAKLIPVNTLEQENSILN